MGSGSASSNSKKSLTFRVTRQKPELVRPAKSTPREFKLLSDIDDQEGLRTQLPAIHFYHNHNNDPRINGTRRRLDPVKVIREAIAKALVFYYPFAGRLREGPGRKLMVECTGEGVLFIEADADVTLEQFGDALQPPFPCLDELLYDVPHSGGILHCPLLLIQVTRLRCGGFIFAYRLNHTMADGAGLSQFMNAVGEIARGASAPSIQPVWQRELLNARDLPRVTCTHHEYDQVADTKGSIIPQDDMVHRSFFFGPAEISALRKSIPLDLSRKCSTFDVLTACFWRCRTIALQPEPNEEVRVMCIVNACSKFNPPLPQGYYGNVIAYPTALTTAGELCNKPVGYAVELVTKVKRVVTEDYMRSVADLMVIKGRPHFTLVRTYLVSDGTRSRLTDVDFGWGKPVYGGPAKGTVASFHIPFKNKKGEQGRVVPIFLPGLAMDRFVSELKNLLLSNNVHRGAITDRSISVKSAL